MFRVSVTGGKVTYAKNGTVFYQSAATPTYPLLVDTALLGMSSTISNVNMVSGSTTTQPPTTTPPSTSATPVPVVWTSLVKTTASGNSLQKTAGCDGCQDAGAVSTQSIASGDGYVEFTVSELTTERAIGLSRGSTGTTIAEINFALLLWPGGEIDVRESGTYRADTTAATGDKFRIAVTGGKVTYAKNGTVFYVSAVAPAYPLLVDTSLETTSATLSNVVMSGVGPVPVAWTSLVNVTATGGSLQKTGGCNGCQDAGAISTQAIASGDGYVEFTVSELTTERAIGLSRGNTDTTIGDIDFALLLWPGGEIDVREGGVYRMDTTAATGDKFRVAVTGGKVTYAKNGTVFYTSAVAPAYSLLVDTSFLTSSGTLTSVVISGAQ
ncbi:MAG: hypothetical protein HY047_08955 [Acidobacteria bacterium]|nr:hypothetical protein [Acidobacteriota bacterium]